MPVSKFTSEQEKARKKWRRALKQRCDMADALRMINHPDRADAHARLDRMFDTIERMEAEARKAFPGVDDSFTIASFEIRL